MAQTETAWESNLTPQDATLIKNSFAEIDKKQKNQLIMIYIVATIAVVALGIILFKK